MFPLSHLPIPNPSQRHQHPFTPQCDPGAEEAEHKPCESSLGTWMSSKTVPLHGEAVEVAGGKGRGGCRLFDVPGIWVPAPREGC